MDAAFGRSSSGSSQEAEIFALQKGLYGLNLGFDEYFRAVGSDWGAQPVNDDDCAGWMPVEVEEDSPEMVASLAEAPDADLIFRDVMASQNRFGKA